MTCWHFYPKCNDYDFKKANTVLIEMNFLADFAGENEVCQLKDHFYWCCGSLGIWGQIPDHRTVKEIISVWWNPTCHVKKYFIWDLMNIFYCIRLLDILCKVLLYGSEWVKRGYCNIYVSNFQETQVIHLH